MTIFLVLCVFVSGFVIGVGVGIVSCADAMSIKVVDLLVLVIAKIGVK